MGSCDQCPSDGSGLSQLQQEEGGEPQEQVPSRHSYSFAAWNAAMSAENHTFIQPRESSSCWIPNALDGARVETFSIKQIRSQFP